MQIRQPTTPPHCSRSTQRFNIKGPKGSRSVQAQHFFRGLFTVDLAADEIIVSVRFAPVKTAAYAKLYQRASHFAIVGVAAALDVHNGVIRSARIGVTGAGPNATRLTQVEAALAGKQPSAATFEAGVAPCRCRPGRRELGPARERGIPAGDGSRLHRAGAGAAIQAALRLALIHTRPSGELIGSAGL